MVDYTERRKTERKKFVNVSPLHHRPYNTERRSDYTERRKTERKGNYITGPTTQREEKFFLEK